MHYTRAAVSTISSNGHVLRLLQGYHVQQIVLRKKDNLGANSQVDAVYLPNVSRSACWLRGRRS
jgi:hypothetical protein